jgi:hypothetical protein
MEFARAWWMKEHEPSNERLRRQTVVAMMKSVDDQGDLNDASDGRLRDGSWRRRVLAETQVRPRVHVARDVVREYALQADATEYDDVVEALTSDRANEALDTRVLPGRSRCGEDVVDLHRGDGGRDVRERRITVVQHVPWRLVLRKRVTELLGRPCGRGMVDDGDVEIRRRSCARTTSTNSSR